MGATMRKTPNKSTMAHSPSLKEGAVLGDGWRIKERKTTNRLADSTHQDTSSLHSEPSDVNAQSATASPHEETPRRRRWCHPLVVLASMGAAAMALIIVADVPPSWLNPSNVSRSASAEAHTSSTSTPGQKQENELDRGYQLHLGVFPSELDARLMWLGLEADPATGLDRLDPLFKRDKSEHGTFYHVLAGTFASHNEADGHCAWLNENKVVCSVVGG